MIKLFFFPLPEHHEEGLMPVDQLRYEIEVL